MDNELYEKRREQMFPKLTATQISRLEAHGRQVGEGSIRVQFVHRALREISVPARQMAAA